MTAPATTITPEPATAPVRDRTWLIAAAILLAALAVRVAFVLATRDISLANDPADYHRLAVNVANGHGFLVMRYGDIDVKGHLGQIPGHTSIMGRDEKSGTTIMLIQNSGAGDFESFYLKGINEPVGKIVHAVHDLG